MGGEKKSKRGRSSVKKIKEEVNRRWSSFFYFEEEKFISSSYSSSPKPKDYLMQSTKKLPPTKP